MTPANRDLIDRFIHSWGAMGAFWGINTSVARVHALLLISDRAYSLDEIAARLTMSKSNVSTSLKELRAWRVVQKSVEPGDRREFYTSEPDPWKMLFNIMRERKAREFEPLLEGARAALKGAELRSSGIALERLRQLEQMLSTFDRLAERLLSSGDQARSVITFLLGKM